MVRDRGNVHAMVNRRQMTQPKGKNAEPIEIPVPTKRDVLGDLAKTARPKSEDGRQARRLSRSDRPRSKKS